MKYFLVIALTLTIISCGNNRNKSHASISNLVTDLQTAGLTGKVRTEIVSAYDSFSNQGSKWIAKGTPYYKSIKKYNPNGYLESIEIYRRNSGALKLDSRTIYKCENNLPARKEVIINDTLQSKGITKYANDSTYKESVYNIDGSLNSTETSTFYYSKKRFNTQYISEPNSQNIQSSLSTLTIYDQNNRDSIIEMVNSALLNGKEVKEYTMTISIKVGIINTDSKGNITEELDTHTINGEISSEIRKTEFEYYD